MADSLPIDPKRKIRKTEFNVPKEEKEFKVALDTAIDAMCDTIAVNFLNEFGEKVLEQHDGAYEIGMMKVKDGNKLGYVIKPNDNDKAVEQEYTKIPLWRRVAAEAKASEGH